MEKHSRDGGVVIGKEPGFLTPFGAAQMGLWDINIYGY